MSKFWDFINYIPKHYAKKKIREAKMDEFLNGAQNNCIRITEIRDDMNYLKDTVQNINNKVNALESDVGHINGRLEIIGSGTKMELFDTLYNWKKMLTDRGWASKAEKDEVKEIYTIYHDGLGGNGQGEVYYNQILNLPEEEPNK